MLKIYGLPSCHNCSDAKDYLTSKGIEYTYIKTVNEVVAKAKELGIMSVPIICKGEKCIVGFNREEVDELIKSMK